MTGAPERAHRAMPRSARLTLAGIVAVLLAASVWLLIRHVRPSNSTGSSSSPMAGMAGMSDSVSSANLDDTAKMSGSSGMPGMNMTAHGSVALTASQIRQFGVTFDTARVRPLMTQIRAPGIATFDETKMSRIAPKVGGFVDKLYINAVGQRVRRGQSMIEIYSPELLAAEQELLLAEQLDRTIGTTAVPGIPPRQSALADASMQRLRLWDISQAQIDAIIRRGSVRRTLTLFAPALGIVVEKKVLQGQAIAPGEALYTIADLSDIWVDAQLRQVDASNVRVGSAADIDFTGVPGHSYVGTVAYVYPTLEKEARTLRARVVVPNPQGVLKPGMYASVRLATQNRSALSVPSAAVLQTGDQDIVFVVVGQGELMPRDVKLGSVAGDYTEILSGLEPGERVVTSAQFLLSSESNLGEVMKGMIGNMGAGDKATQDMQRMQMPSSTPPPRR